MNVVLVFVDTLRQDHVGAYGNTWIRTPHLDAFAREAVRFTRAYPESLPTLPVRRAVHTGLRTFPYHGHRRLKGDFDGAPGWGPIPEEQDTMSELLSAQGYRTALITDCYHQFKPSKNFHRGFAEWIWVRGQEADRYRSGPPASDAMLAPHMTRPRSEQPGLAHFLGSYFTNNSARRGEADHFAPRVFSEAVRWLVDNCDAEKFFLVIDSFDPHEPWDPPEHYRRLYDPDDDVVDVIQSLYGPWEGRLTPREVRRLQANYAGEVTMVDRWFGHFYEALRLSGRLDDTVVAVLSDHGHNLGYDPQDQGLISKQGHPMTRSVADLVMMVRHPKGTGSGTACDALVYNLDLTPTLLDVTGVEPKVPLDGKSLWPLVTEGRRGRDHVTIGWGPLITVITDEWWYNASIWGESELLYRVATDPLLEHEIHADQPKICGELRELAIADAGGSIPAAFADYHSKPGCTPYRDAYESRMMVSGVSRF